MSARPRPFSHAIDLLLVLGAVALFYPKIALPNRISPGGDMVNLMLPARDYAQHWLAQGTIPLWNPQTFGGAPFLAAMQSGTLYPLNLAAGAVLPPLAALNFLRLFHVFLFGGLTWLFLRVGRGHVRAAALLGALAVAGSAHVSSHMDHPNQLAAMAWLPALVFCQWRYWQTGSRPAILLLAAVVAVQVLAGHPQAVFYSLLLSAAIAVAHLAAARLDGGLRDPGTVLPALLVFRKRLARFGWVMAALAGGLLLASIQYLPTAEAGELSRRVLDGVEYATFGSMPRRAVWTVVFPRLFGNPLDGYTDPMFGGEFGSFVGRLTLALAIAALVVAAIRRSGYGYIVLWLAVIVVAYILALGKFGPFAAMGAHGLPPRGMVPEDLDPSRLFRAWLSIVPPARHLRVPPRILLLATFGLAVLGAEALNWLLTRPWWTGRNRARNLLAVGVVAVLGVELWMFQRKEFHTLVVRHFPSREVLTPQAHEVLDPLACAESSSLPAFRTFRLMLNDPDYLMDVRPSAVGNRYFRLQSNLGMLLGASEVEGYEEGLLPPILYFDFINYFNRNLRSSNPDVILCSLMNARYLYVDYNLPVLSNAWQYRGEVPELETGHSYKLYENPLWLPRVLWLDQLPRTIRFDELRGTLSRGRPSSPRMSIMRRYGVNFEGATSQTRLVAPEQLNSLVIRSIRPNDMIIDNPSRRGGALFISQNVYPGWTVRAGAEAVPVRRFTDFSGVANIPAGADRLAIEYRPFSFRLGAYVTLFALSNWIALVLALARKRPLPIP